MPIMLEHAAAAAVEAPIRARPEDGRGRDGDGAEPHDETREKESSIEAGWGKGQ